MTKQVQETPKSWKMVGSRAYLWNRKRYIKPGQIFTALESDLPDELKVMVILVDESAKVLSAPPPPPPKTESLGEPSSVTYRMKMRRGEGEDGTFDIIDSRGKRVNELPLTKDQATEMIRSLRS